MTVFNLIDYYQALNGESTLDKDRWYTNYDKSHVFKIYSDLDVIDEYTDKLILSPSESQTETIDDFSTQLDQKFKNTKISYEEDGSEKIELNLDDRIITIVVDQSGSMLWNDNSNFRHRIIEDIINKIENNYPGDIRYNLIEYGGKLINVLLFGVIEENVDTTEVDSIDDVLTIDENENFSKIRVIRNSEHYSQDYNSLDGELVNSGFIGEILDEDLSEGHTYYYKVYTENASKVLSKGAEIKITPREKDIPRGISIFKSFVESTDVEKGVPLIGKGIYKDDYTIGIWHFDEGIGSKLFDFSNSNVVLDINNEEPEWIDSLFSAVGDHSLYFNGISDYAKGTDTNNNLELLFDDINNKFTLTAWIFPYEKNSDRIIISREDSSSTNYSFGIDANNKLFFTDNVSRVSSSITVENYKWQFVAITFDGSITDPSQAVVNFYINKQTESVSFIPSIYSSGGTSYINVGSTLNNSSCFKGRIGEVSVHNVSRDSSYIFDNLVEDKIYNNLDELVDTEYTGLKEDNGDRVVVLKYQIPEDYNFGGGKIRIIKNSLRKPSWEEDGDNDSIFYETEASIGTFYISDPSDFVLGDTYYYRIYSQNSIGNFSYYSDSPCLEFEIPVVENRQYLPDRSYVITSPQEPSFSRPLITPGNRKNYLQWSQLVPYDDKIQKVKIYYSSIDYPTINADGGSDGELVFSGLITDEKFVHRNISNDIRAYYRIINMDKYGRTSNYDIDGTRIESFLQATAIPTKDADEKIIPLPDVENIHYEIVDNNSISISWDLPEKNPEDLNVYFDQTIIIYASITDQYGEPISEDTPINLFIKSNIIRDNQAEDVFVNTIKTEFTDREAYDFFVDRNDNGLIKATLKITDDPNIIPQIKEASFEIQIKSFVPKEGITLYDEEHSTSTGSLSDYASVIETEIQEVLGETTTTETSNNIFEYFSKKINIKFTNPWEVEIVNRDNAKVEERCYVPMEDEITKEKYLSVVYEDFNGVYIGASSPFIARAKVKYKGEPAESGTVDLVVWDADSSNLCANAGVENSESYEGEKIQVSQTVLLSSDNVPIVLGEETEIIDGATIIHSISYVDVPLYAPKNPQAIRLYAKASNASFSSVKDIYVLFQNTLQIDIQANAPKVDGKEVSEQQAQTYIIDPDHPNFRTNNVDKNFITYPIDNTVVQWDILLIEGNNSRKIFSIDNVSIPNGIYSYTRNGVARNVFMGPIQKEIRKIEETHEIRATIVYNGLSATARQYVKLLYDPEVYEGFSARFLMENDGGWVGRSGNFRWGGAGWLNSESSTLWTDGSDYRRIKIHRNPRIATSDEFASSDAFRECTLKENSEILELDSEQIINIQTEDDSVEILHGEIIEEIDPYTGKGTLRVGEDGFLDKKEANIVLNDQEISDITYFYIRINKFVPDSKPIFPDFLTDEEPINDCIELKPSTGLFKKDLPRWEPVFYLSGTTILYVNNQPLTLIGGGTMEKGIPPIPVCMKEPLGISVFSRQVKDNNSNTIFEIGNNNFVDKKGKSYIKHDSDVIIKVQVFWRNEAVPDNTPVYVLVGDSQPGDLFIPLQDIYYTETESDGNSYATITIVSSRVPEQTTTEQVEIYTTYDERGEIDRKRSVFFNLTIDREDETVVSPTPTPENPEEVLPPVLTPYSGTIERYNISTNEWSTIKSLSEPKGNIFAGTVNNNIFAMGGLKSNLIEISPKNEKYDILIERWTEAEPMLTPRFGGISFTFNNNIYTIGGIGADPENNGEINVSRAVEVYNTEDDEWQVLTSMPIVNEGQAFEEKLGVAFGTSQLVYFNNRNYVYVLCGINSISKNSDNQIDIREYNKRILRYCIEDNSWEYSDELFTDEMITYARISPLSILNNNKIIVFNGAIEKDSSFIYPVEDFYIDITSSLSRSNTDRYIHEGSNSFNTLPVSKYQSAFAENNRNPSLGLSDYYIFGGSNEDSPNLDIVEKITTDASPFIYENSYSGSIENASLIPLKSMIVEKHGATAVLANGLEGSDLIPYIYIIGGFTSAREENFVEIEFDI